MNTDEERKAEEREEKKHVIALASDALNRLGRTNCVVICPVPPSPTFTNNGSFRTWKVRATDDDKNETCAIDVEADPSKTDEQIRAQIIESFSAATWKPVTGSHRKPKPE